ncbi:hypothetical protein ACLILZ_33775, partial [Mycobacterium paragordonae]
RFRQLATLREYGHYQLSAHERAELRQRHLDWYRQLAEQAGLEWHSEHQLDWLHRLHWETPDLREAMRFAQDAAPSAALEMAINLRNAWAGMGKLQQGRQRIEQFLGAVSAEPSAQRLRAVTAVAELAFLQADIPTLTARQAEARHMLDRVGDDDTIAHFKANDAALALLCGQLERAQSLAQEPFATAGEFRTQIYALLVMIWAAAAAGDAPTAVAHAEHGLKLSEARGHDIVLRGYLLAALALGRMVLGNLDGAEQAIRECIPLSRGINDTNHCSTLLETAAWIATARQEPRRAAVLMAAAAAISRASGADVISANVGGFHDSCERQVREQLSPADYRSASNQGRFLSLDEAVALVLDESI